MTTPEGRVKAKITPVLRARMDRGLWYYMPVPAGYGRSTVDYLGCFFGHFFAIEAKREGETPNDRQKGELEDIVAAGGTSFVIDGDAGVRMLDEWLTTIENWRD